MTPSLPTEISTLETKPGKEWTDEECETCRGWLISQKWGDLQRVVSCVIPPTAADHRAAVMAAFLNGKLDSILRGYKPGFSGLLPYVLLCLRRYCYEAVKRFNCERGLIRPITENEAEPASFNLSSPLPGTPLDSLLDQAFQALVQKEFARLEPCYREPLLRRIRGATYEEIARELRLSMPAVKIRIFRARQKLRTALRAAWPGNIF